MNKKTSAKKTVSKKVVERSSPKTELAIDKYLKGHSKADLARVTGIIYPQLHNILKSGANPTLLMLERIAEGLSQLNGQKIGLKELLKL